MQARNEQPHNPESSAVLSGSARITERGPSCTSHRPPPPVAWERANAREEGRRSAVLGGEGDPPKSPSHGPSPFLVLGKTLGSLPPSFAGVLGVRLALGRSGDSFARKIHALGGWMVLQSTTGGDSKDRGGRTRSHSPRTLG